MITVLGFVNIYPVSVAYGLPGSGETLSGKEFYTALGGKGANQALLPAGQDVTCVWSAR
jgi:sugar/nucleoside kinase (ribokinase family)